MKFKALTMTLGVCAVGADSFSPVRPVAWLAPALNSFRSALPPAECSSRRLFGLAKNYGPPQIMGQRLQQRQCQHFLSATDRHLVHPALMRSALDHSAVADRNLYTSLAMSVPIR